MGCDDVECVTELVARRFGLLDALTEGARTKGELETDLAVSRSTIDRAVRSLEAEEIVRRDGGAVSLTLFGRSVLEGYRDFRAGLEGLTDARPLFDSFDDEAQIPFGLFREAEVVNANRRSPHRPIVALQQFLDDAQSVQSVVTGLLPEYVRTYHTQVVDNDMVGEIVVRSPVLDKLLATYWDPISDVLETEQFCIYELDADPPFSLKIVETEETTEVAIITYGDQGVSGFIRTESAEAVSWATDQYEQVKARANLVAPMD